MVPLEAYETIVVGKHGEPFGVGTLLLQHRLTIRIDERTQPHVRQPLEMTRRVEIELRFHQAALIADSEKAPIRTHAEIREAVQSIGIQGLDLESTGILKAAETSQLRVASV